MCAAVAFAYSHSDITCSKDQQVVEDQFSMCVWTLGLNFALLDCKYLDKR